MNTVFGQTLYDRLGPIVEDDPDGVAIALCDMAGAMFQRLDEIVTDSDLGPGYSMILDPDRAPVEWLDWTAALYGVSLVTGSSEAERRAEIRELPPQHRGTLAYMVASIQQAMTGTKSVRIIERVGTSVDIDTAWNSVGGTWNSQGATTWDGMVPFSTTAYSFSVLLRSSEVPDSDTATARAIAAKPGGLDMEIAIQAEYAWLDATGTWNAAGTTTWDATATTPV